MVSIHLILLFIRFGKVPVIVTQMFQYISCYSLSGSIGELSVVNRLFQYISCYSLSIKTMVSVGIRKVSIHLMLLFIGLLQSNSEPHSPFQYISCYSLSKDHPVPSVPFLQVSIHLMLLFILEYYG